MIFIRKKEDSLSFGKNRIYKIVGSCIIINDMFDIKKNFRIVVVLGVFLIGLCVTLYLGVVRMSPADVSVQSCGALERYAHS